MTRAPRHTTLADRAAAATNPPRNRNRRYLLTGELDQRGVLAVVHATKEWQEWAVALLVASHARDADDCRLLLDALGLLKLFDLDDRRDLP